MSAPAIRPASYAEYLALGEDVCAEYIDERIVISPSPTGPHQWACRNLANVLDAAIPADHRVSMAWSWRAGANEFIPDVMVHPRSEDVVRFTGLPVLVVEVLSGNGSDDLVVKLDRYATAGLPHYWILDPRDRVLLAHVLEGHTYHLIRVVTEAEAATVLFGVGEAMVDVAALLA